MAIRLGRTGTGVAEAARLAGTGVAEAEPPAEAGAATVGLCAADADEADGLAAAADRAAGLAAAVVLAGA